MTNCINCGAVLKGGVCEYCGTEYETTVSTLHAADGSVITEEKTIVSNCAFQPPTAEEVMERFHSLVSAFGITAKEAAENLSKLNNAVRKVGFDNGK